MNTLLLEHFDQLITTPEDVDKLNTSILNLAMQGKLVDQDNGSWAEKGVKAALAKEIQGFIDAGKMTKPSKILPISKHDIPQNRPNNWICIRLGECLGLVNGRAYKQSELLDSGTQVIRIQNLNGSDRWYYSDLELSPEKYCDTNDLLFAWSASFGPYIWEGDRSIYHYHIWKIELTSYINKKYAYFLLKYLTEQVKNASHGLAMLHITKEKMENWAILLPPLAEQQRIVTRVEELFAQTRLLAEQLTHSRTELDRLNQSALAHLLASQTAEEFNHRWSFIAQQFDTLFQTPEHITPLRQTILELAVRGKLTHPEPGDEPAKELLKRIKEDKGDKVKPSKPINENDKSFEMPKGWEWVRLKEVTIFLQTGPFGSNLHKSDYVSDGTPVVNPVNMRDGKITINQGMLISGKTLERLSQYILETGDLVLARRGEIGRCALVTERENGWLCGTGSLRLRVARSISSDFMVLLFKTDFARRQLSDQTVGITMSNMSQTALENLIFALPPLAEQERIVKRVEQLLSICDALEAQLQTAETERHRLLESTLAQLTTPSPSARGWGEGE